MELFKSIKSKVIDFMKDKDFVSIDEILVGTEITKRKIKSSLMSMKYKNIVEEKEGKWKLLSKNVEQEPKAETIIQPKLVTNSVSAQVLLPKKKEPLIEAGEAISRVLNLMPDAEPKEEIKQEVPDDKPKGMNEKLDDLHKQLEILSGMANKKKKEKKFKLKRFNVKKLKRYNKGKGRACLMLSRHQNITLVKGEYLNGMIRIGENFYDASAMFTWLWHGKQPCYLIPEWSIRPICPPDLYTQAREEGNLIDSQIITIRAAKMIELDKEESGDKKKMSPMLWVGLLIGGAVVVWLMFGGNKPK